MILSPSRSSGDFRASEQAIQNAPKEKFYLIGHLEKVLRNPQLTSQPLLRRTINARAIPATNLCE